MLLNVHRINTPNQGDVASGPLRYVQGPSKMAFADIMDCLGRGSKAETQLAKASLIVFGGGGLIDLEKFNDGFRYLAENYGEKTVIGGAGSNMVKHKPFRTDLSGVRLVGLRDFSDAESNRSARWVPCASCLSQELHQMIRNKRRFHQGGIGLLENNARKNAIRVGDCGRSDVRRFGNRSVSLRDMVEFILSVDVLVTSSFHGLYWATLCQVPAIGIPTTSKFHTLKHRHVLSTADDWSAHLNDVQVFPSALEECVEANLAFMKQVNQTFPGTELQWQRRNPIQTRAYNFGRKLLRRVKKAVRQSARVR